MPSGGIRSSLAGMVAALTRPRTPNPKGKGAPILSYSYGAQGVNTDMTQFAPVFQPSGGMFAPGYPLVPPEPEKVRVRDFPVGFNYVYTPRSYEPIGFDELRGLADSHAVTRGCIETRKDQIESLDWTIGAIDPGDETADTRARSAVQKAFWKKPDGITSFGTWLRMALEDVLVIDAPAFELRRNRGGDIIAIDVIDGATIKVLIDDTGRRPVPPAPAFEQIIHGRPWVLAEDGRRDTDARGTPIFDDQLIYMPRNPRSHKAYGFAPVEQIIITVNTAIRREYQQLQWFTESNVPRSIIEAPEGWTTEQLAQFQEWWDSLLAGNTANRTKMIWTPPGSKYHGPLVDNPYSGTFDEWLARVVCFAFSLPPHAFVRPESRAAADTAKEAALEEGLAPLMAWVKRLIDTIIQDRMGQKDLEFKWNMPPEIDAAEQAEILSRYVKDGIYSINDALDILGMEPVEGGDERIMMTTAGPILLRYVLAGGTPGGSSQNPLGSDKEPATV